MLKIPPSEMKRQQEAAVHRVGMNVDETLVAPLRVIPCLPSCAELPEMMPHRAHLHAYGSLETPLDLKDELVGPVPALIRTTQDTAAINGIEVYSVEIARIHDVGMIPGDILKQRRLRIRYKKAEAFLEMTGLGPF